MSITSRLINRLLKLPPAETHAVAISRDLKIPMPDEVVLLADHYIPRSGPGNLPTILIRSPYGRAGFFAYIYALPLSLHGFQVLIQSCRGTAGSGGEFEYARNEHADGLATIEWIKKQAWYSGELAMVGGSYLGFVQWAVASYAGPDLKAIVPSITSTDFDSFRYQGGSLCLEEILGWSTMMTETAATGTRFSDALKSAKRTNRLQKAYFNLPLKEADLKIVGKPSKIFRETIEHPREDEYWKPVIFSQTLPELDVPVSLIGGWYDMFIHWQLKDYRALREAGKKPYLLIGPWYHGETKSFAANARESLDFIKANVKGDTRALRKDPVRLYIMGANEWRDYPEWPVPTREERWYLQPGGGLGPSNPVQSTPDRYTYDPADPTPTVGGNSLGKYMGAKDNRKIEQRADVMVYTSRTMEKEMEIIGPVMADLYVSSSLEHTDFFARLCVVEESGKSINLCDGIVRITPTCPERQADGTLHLQIEMWPTAYRFSPGQRIRLQVSSGAFPRFARNPGTGDPLGCETKLLMAEQAIYHDPDHPSSIVLPVTPSL